MQLSNGNDRKAFYLRYPSGHIIALLFVPSSKTLSVDVSEDEGASWLGRKTLATWS